jgi:hypothetical protein
MPIYYGAYARAVAIERGIVEWYHANSYNTETDELTFKCDC